LLLATQPGDKIIVPDFIFVSTINGFVLRGGSSDDEETVERRQ